ncbi:MAG: hypothetical protein H0T42_34765 [Deltaproteobacteria bacterium]|nr:hypothetical protein [Deltaproteobacteria bacterium]
MRFTTTTILSLTAALAGCGDDTTQAPDAPIPQPEQLVLPGNAFYPESLTAHADGTLYVGSLGTGQVVAYANGDESPRTIIAGHGVTNVAGVAVHDDTLWLCSVDVTFQRPTELRSFSLDGVPGITATLAANQFCNDIELDTAGNVYATDSFSGAILRLRPGATTLETWTQDARFAASMQGAFGLDGIAYDGTGALLVNTLDRGKLFRVPITASGAAGAITEITVTPPLASPDGMRALDADTLLVVEGPGRLTQVDIAGNVATATPLVSGLDMPTSVVVARGSAWISEGQLGRLFTGAQPIGPFLVKRVDL